MNKKSILITGSSRGIGRACAKAYAKAGYHVFLNCVHQVERLKNSHMRFSQTVVPVQQFPEMSVTLTKSGRFFRLLKKSVVALIF